jgi:hypothetical protein
VPTPPPATPTPSPVASGCTGSAKQNQWFADQTAHVSWSVYCAVLPSGWTVSTVYSDYNNGGYVRAVYVTVSGGYFSLFEGHFCAGAKTGCGVGGTSLGTTQFGDISGELFYDGSNYSFWADCGAHCAYTALAGAGTSEATFRSYLAAMHKVP